MSSCHFWAVAKGAGNTILDLAGLIPGEKAAAVILRSGATAALATEALLTWNGRSGALVAAGETRELAGAVFDSPEIRSSLKGIAKDAAEAIPLVGYGVIAVSVGNDVSEAADDYQKCDKGP